MKRLQTTNPNPQALAQLNDVMQQARQAANEVAARRVFNPRIATRALNKRVELLGRHAGIEGLSPHDCRHYAATFEARKGTPVDRLVDMFGWNSPAMAFRYIEAVQITNEGTVRVKSGTRPPR